MAEPRPRYKDPSESISSRVEDLLERMSLDEKIAQLGCMWSTALVNGASFDPDAAAAKIPHGIGQITRIGASTGLRPAESAAFMNAIQKVAVEQTRLGIPIFVHEESTGGFLHRDATVFPQGIGLAATWDQTCLSVLRVSFANKCWQSARA
jgi:beta-glucosidase